MTTGTPPHLINTNMKKTDTIFLIAWLLTTAFLYFGFSFCNWTFHPYKWGEIGRTFFVFLEFMAIVVFTGIAAGSRE